MKLIAVLFSLAFAFPVSAQVLVQEGFESYRPETTLPGIGPLWHATTVTFKVGNQAGFAASGDQYLSAPSRTGTGDRQRFGWFDASGAFNARDAGSDLIVATVKMFIPVATESTFGGMALFDQVGGNWMAVIGVEMIGGMTLTDATIGVNNVAVKFGEYNDIELLANFAVGNIDYFFNGTEIGSKQMAAASRAAGLGDFDFYNNGFNATTSVAFRYDDYKVQAVPEPSTYVMVGMGFLALLGARKMKV